MEARLTELEIRYTHQEELLLQLSDVVADQQQQLAALRDEVKRLHERISSQGGDGPVDEPPPHY